MAGKSFIVQAPGVNFTHICGAKAAFVCVIFAAFDGSNILQNGRH
jgi:hypothetical protein